ncbi:MAG: hypothetical protein RLZZ136_235 [Pseudomonadota bacterium]|jgi:AcrR family transcriptional regulator
MRSRFQNLEPDRQERLIEAAIAEFCSLGFEASSLNRILKEAGMSKSSFYYYFDDKADIFDEIGRRSIAMVIAEIGKVPVASLTYASFWSEIEDMLLRAKTVLEQDQWFVRMCRLYYHHRSGGDPEAADSPLFGSIREWIHALITHGRSIGVVRTDLPPSLLISIAMGLAEAMDRWTSQAWDSLSSAERGSMLRQEVALFRRLLE